MKNLEKILMLFMFISFLVYAQIPTKESVTKLYVATFNRAPDSAGLNYWLNSSGLSLEGIAKSFFEQPETKALYPSIYSNHEFIKAVYENLFNREPDSKGWSYWENELNNNPDIDRSVFILAVINGALGNDSLILSNKERVGEYFADKGLNDTTKAKEIMADINNSSDSVQNALNLIDKWASNIIFISSAGDDDNDGSFKNPLKDTLKLCRQSNIFDGTTIYFREGIYNNFPTISCSGTSKKPLIIKPYNNERVKFTFDGAKGVRLNGNYIKLSGIEVEGVAEKIKYEDALKNWWRGDRYYNGSGIVAKGHHIEISDCIVHSTPGSGISASGGDYINIHDNIVYNGDWWTIAGSKGIGVTNASASDNNGYIKIENNLIFNVESRIYSRVWSKGFAKLTIDEGEGILVQINDGNYTGRYTIKNNFLLFDGKGIVINKTDRADILNNTLYHTGTTISGQFKGIRASLTKDTLIKDNSVEILGEGISFSLGKSDISQVKLIHNCGNGKEQLAGVEIRDKIFKDPEHLDFTPIDGCSGADINIWNRLKTKLDKLGVEIAPTNWVPDYDSLTKGVIDNIPKGSKIDWSGWKDNEPSELKVTDIPKDGIKSRPKEFKLEIVHPLSL